MKDIETRTNFVFFLLITLLFLSGFIFIQTPTGFSVYEFINEDLLNNLTEGVVSNEILEEIIEPIEIVEEENETIEEPIEIEDTNKTEEDNITIEESLNITIEDNVTIEPIVEINETVGAPNITIQVNITKVTNVTEKETKVISRVEIGKPVKFVKKVRPINVSEKVRVELPKEATNIKVDKIEDGVKSDVDPNNVIVEGLELKDYNQITGSFVVDVNINDNIIVRIISWLRNFFRNITGFVVLEERDSTEVIIEETADEFELEYELPGPQVLEEEVNSIKKRLIVFSDIHYENILTYTDIIESKEENINLYWLVNDSKVLVEDVTYVDNDNNGLIDRIEWITPYLSEQIYEVDITILNVQSYPQVGGNWEVRFSTTGIANLTITAFGGTTWSNVNEDNDLKFLQVKCGSNILDYEWIDNGPENSSVFIQDYECNEKGFEISKVLTRGKHTLEFRFGDDVDYAFNLAGDFLNISTAYDVRIHGETDAINEGFSNKVIIGDLNNDGIDDLIIGASSETPPAKGKAGKTYVFYGPFDKSGTLNVSDIPPNITFNGIAGNDNSGSGLGIADLNNDGANDMIIGASGANTDPTSPTGEVYVMYGPFANGTNQIIEISDRLNITYEGRVEGDAIGGMEFSNPDLNNDGIDDLIIGAKPVDGPDGDNQVGNVYVLFGPLQNGSSLRFNVTDVTNITYHGIKHDDKLGSSASSGDFNNDSADDLIMGAHFADPVCGTSCGQAGEVYVVYGPLPEGINQTFNVTDVRNITFNGDVGSDNTGDSVGSGDFNNDNVTDILIGASGSLNLGRVYILYGPFVNGSSQLFNITDVYNISYHGVRSGGLNQDFGSGVAGGDINNDGIDDLSVGAPQGDFLGLINIGFNYIVYGLVGDQEGPLVDLQSPDNSTWTAGNNVHFIFNVTDLETNVQNCSLYTNETGSWILEESNSSVITEGNNFTLEHILNDDASYLWNIRCYDNSTNVNNAFDSANWTVTVNIKPLLVENDTWQQDLTAFDESSLVLGDLDNDNDLDLILSGDIGGTITTKVYINNGSFYENSTWQGDVTQLKRSSMVFGDIDNDGDLDLVAAGLDDSTTRVSRVFINNGTSLRENSTWQSDLSGVQFSSLALGDLDLDGKLDLVLTGQLLSGRAARVYINNGTRFNENTSWQQDLTGVESGSIALGDLDNDGDLDLVLTGSTGGTTTRSGVYINNGSSLVEDGTWQNNLTNVSFSSIALGDLDNDGDLDLILSGSNGSNSDINRCNGSTKCAEVYFNDGSTFLYNASFSDNLSFVSQGAVALGDVDNDGNLDLALFGTNDSSDTGIGRVATNNLSLLYENISWYKNLIGVFRGDAALGDVDNDSKLDLVAIGTIGGGSDLVKLYTSNWTTDNTKPSASNLFNATFSGSILTLSWSQGSDTETPTAGLYYNLRVGTSSGSNDIVSGKYGGSGKPAAGYFGNMMQRTSISITVSSNQKYFWSVQTIDSGLLASSFSSEQIITDQPIVDLQSPANDTWDSSTSVQFIFNVTDDDDDGIYNCSLYTDESGSWQLEESNDSVITEGNDYTITHVITEGNAIYNWNVRCYDDSATRNNVFDDANWTVDLSISTPPPPDGGGGGRKKDDDEPPPEEEEEEEEEPPPEEEEEPPDDKEKIKIASIIRDGNNIILNIVKGTEHNVTKINISLEHNTPKVQLEFGVEQSYPNTCFNGILDGDELGIDCGGSCGICLTIEQPSDYTCTILVVISLLLVLLTALYKRYPRKNKIDKYFSYIEAIVLVLFILLTLVFTCWLALFVVIFYVLYEQLVRYLHEKKSKHKITHIHKKPKELVETKYGIYNWIKSRIKYHYAFSLMDKLKKEIIKGNYIYVAEKLADLRISLNQARVNKRSRVWSDLLKLEEAVKIGFLVDDALIYVKKKDFDKLGDNLDQINSFGYVPEGKIKKKYNYCLRYYNYHNIRNNYFISRKKLNKLIKKPKLNDALKEYAIFAELNGRLVNYESVNKIKLLHKDLESYRKKLEFLFMRNIATTKPSEVKISKNIIVKPKRSKFIEEVSLMRKHFNIESKKIYSLIKKGDLKEANYLYYNLVEYYNSFINYEYYEDQEGMFFELRKIRDDLSATFIKRKMDS